MTQPKLAAALAQACRAHADRVALEGEDLRLTYAELLSRASGLAEALREGGVVPGDPVMVRCSNHPSDFAAFLAAWLAGGAAVPVHRSAPAEVVATLQAKAQCRAALDLLAEAPQRQVGMLRGAGEPQRHGALLRDAALVIFTSGSTGAPKGVVLGHEAFHGKLRQNQNVFPATPGTVCLLVLNDTFSFGIWVALLALLQGGKVLTRAKFDPRGFLDALATRGVTFVGVVPTMIRATFAGLSGDELAQARRALQASATLQTMVIGGEPLGSALSAELRQFIAPARLYDVYGLTETSTSDFILDPADYPAHAASIGKPAPGIRFRIAGEHGEECPAGVAGELQLRSPYLMAGYLGDEALSEAAFADGWFRTGDLAARDGEFVTIVGRLKELIVRGGNKITPMEVERALSRCAGVADAMVAGMPDPILGQRIHALLIPRAGGRLDDAALRRELAGALEKHKHPDVFYVGDALPTGRTGKIDRGQLQKMLASGGLQPLGGQLSEGRKP